MKSPALKVSLVIIIFVMGLASYWLVGVKAEKSILDAADQSAFYAIEDYSKGLFESQFRLVAYGGQLRLLGTVKHGPILLGKMKPAIGHVHLTIDPFQSVTSPWKELVETYPEIRNIATDVLINLNGQYAITGTIPAMEIDIVPSGKAGLIVFNGMTFEGSGIDGNFFINGNTHGGSFINSDMEVKFASLAFSAEGEDFLATIPTTWASNITLTDLTANWQTDAGSKLISIDTILAKSSGKTEQELVSAGIAYQIKGLTIDGENTSQINYSIKIDGLDRTGVNELTIALNEAYALADPNASVKEQQLQMMQAFEKNILPAIYKVFGGQPAVLVKVKTEQPTFGTNEGMFKLQLGTGTQKDILSRIMAGLTLDLDKKSTKYFATLMMGGNETLNDLSKDEREKVQQVFLDELTSDQGILELKDNRYAFGASFAGKDGMIKYGKAGHSVPAGQFLQIITPFFN